jgi:succinate dehydrogenase hydrophobic anchor subunit
MIFDLNKLSDSHAKVPTMVLNIVSGLALLIAASWFSYNVFSTRDAAQATVQDTQSNSNDIKALERKIIRSK